jgi:hypothetical protein
MSIINQDLWEKIVTTKHNDLHIFNYHNNHYTTYIGIIEINNYKFIQQSSSHIYIINSSTIINDINNDYHFHYNDDFIFRYTIHYSFNNDIDIKITYYPDYYISQFKLYISYYSKYQNKFKGELNNRSNFWLKYQLDDNLEIIPNSIENTTFEYEHEIFNLISNIIKQSIDIYMWNKI